MGNMLFKRFTRSYDHKPIINGQRMDKNSGFVQEDNSGRANIFSTGDKALYSYSPTSDNVTKQGLGGIQGFVIVTTIAAAVLATTFNISFSSSSQSASDVDMLN